MREKKSKTKKESTTIPQDHYYYCPAKKKVKKKNECEFVTNNLAAEQHICGCCLGKPDHLVTNADVTPSAGPVDVVLPLSALTIRKHGV